MISKILTNSTEGNKDNKLELARTKLAQKKLKLET